LGHNVEIETHSHANHRKFPFDKVKIKSFIDALDRTALGIKFGQGFLFAEPVPLNRLTAWARSVSRKDGPLAPKPSMTR
jgi:hypothetical protein